MASPTPQVIVHCFVVPAHVRRSEGGHVARVAVCCIPKVFGQPGAFASMRDLPVLKDLPTRLQGCQFEVELPGGRRFAANPRGARADLWKWSGDSFVEIQPMQVAGQSLVMRADGEELPYRYPRASLASLVLGSAVQLDRQKAAYASSTFSGDGLYPALTAAALLPEQQPISFTVAKVRFEQLLAGAIRQSDTAAAYGSSIRAHVVGQLDALRASGSVESAERTLAEFRHFHSMHEGPDDRAPDDEQRLLSAAAGDDAGRRIILTLADRGKLLQFSSAYPVWVEMPSGADTSFSVRLRNDAGTLRIDKRGDIKLAEMALKALANRTDAGYWELRAGRQFEVKLTALGWMVDAPPVAISVSSNQDGLILESEDIQGVEVTLPPAGSISPGFKITACNRAGNLRILGNGSALRLVPEGLDVASSNLAQEFNADVSVLVHWDGTQWNIVRETTDDEFHRSVAGLNNYPALAREIGLTWDVDLPLTEAEVNRMPASGRLRLIVQKTLPERFALQPFDTAFEWTPLPGGKYIAFGPAPKDAGKPDGAMPVSVGFMDLSVCAVNQVELDTPSRAMFAQVEMKLAKLRYPRKLLSGQLSLDEEEDARDRFARTGGGPTDPIQLLPALVEAGVELSHPAWHVAQQLAVRESNRLRSNSAATAARLTGSSMRPVSAGIEDVMYQESLTRGCRYDVLEATNGRWHSLCRQTSAITRHGDAISIPVESTDEGVVTAGVTGVSAAQHSDGSVTPVSRGSDVIFRWAGWGVTLPRPMAGDTPTSSAPVGGLGLVAIQKIPAKSQYKLRAGNLHRFRARLVDIAGNGWTCEEADDLMVSSKAIGDLLSPLVQVQRFQPSKAPKFYRDEGGRLTEVRTFVIRSFDHGLVAHAEYAGVCPRINFELTQLLGVTDHCGSPNEQLRLIREAHDRSLHDEPAESDNPAKDAGEKLLAKHLGFEDPHVRGIAWRFLPGHERANVSEGSDIVTLATGDPTLSEVAPVLTPYRLGRLPSGKEYPSGTIQVFLKPGKVRSAEVRGQELWVSLPKGESQSVVVSSSLASEALPALGLWNAAAMTVARQPAPDRTPQMAIAATGGAASTLTPNTVVQFIHASQRPRRAPLLTGAAGRPLVVRGYGEKDAKVSFDYQIHQSSTARIDVEARWTDVDDVPDARRWTPTDQHAAIEHWAINSPDLTFAIPVDSIATISLTHHLPDTRRRVVRYRATATSRYSEFFNRQTTGADGKRQPTRGLQAPKSDPYLVEEDFQLDSDDVLVDIPNALEPPPFEIEYIVPKSIITDSYHFGGNVESVDTTRELRVYLRRPAKLSGFEERLGVLVAPASAGSAPGNLNSSFEDEDADAVSEMSEDPLSFSLPIRPGESRLTQEFFPQPDEPGRQVIRRPVAPQRLTRDFGSERTATVLGYEVHEIEGEDLLFADVRIAATSRAAPFLRLALVRYQPHSVTGAHISNRPAFAFVRPAADRTATIQFRRVSHNPFSMHRRLVVNVVGPARVGNDYEVGSDMFMTLSRRASNSANAGFQSKGPLALDKKWLSREKFTALWTIELDVELYRLEDGEEPIRGHCKVEIEELSSLVPDAAPSWFTELGVGWIRWPDEAANPTRKETA